MVKRMADGGVVTTQPDPKDSNEWEKIKNWVSARDENVQKKHPLEMLGMDEGGEVPGMPNRDDVMDFIAPRGSGQIVPSPTAAPIELAEAPETPDTGPEVSAAPVSTPTAPIAPAGAGGAPTDAAYEAQADKILGSSPEARKALFQHLQKADMWSQIPALLAGFGDSIARGYGKDPTANHMGDLEKQLGEQDKGVLENADAVAKIGKERYEVGQTLEARDFNSPLSKQLQTTYGPLLIKTGFKPEDIAKMSASNIADLTGKSVDVLKAEAESSMAAASLGLKAAIDKSTIQHQRSEEENASKGRKLDAAKALAGRGPLDKVAGVIPGTTSHEVKKALEGELNDSPTPKGPVPVNSKEEYAALPKGTHYVDSYGKEKVKR